MTEENDKWLEKLRPTDAKSLDEYRKVVGVALRVMANDRLPAAEEIEETPVGKAERFDGVRLWRAFWGRKGSGERVPVINLFPYDFDGTVIVWVHPEGKASLFRDGKLTPEARRILDRKAAIVAPDVFGVGELSLPKPYAVDKGFAGYTFGYNRPLVMQRVHDILTVVGWVRGAILCKKVHLVGVGKAGPWVLLARGLCGDAVDRTAADADGFRFEKVRSTDDEMMLPGALKYGGLAALAGLAAPHELRVHHHSMTGMGRWLKAVYAAAGADKDLRHEGDRVPDAEIIDWLLR
jgi:hypothetical protein